MKISIVVPCYNEKETVELFYHAVVEELLKIGYDYELIYVNDGSKDSTWEVIKSLAKRFEKVKAINLSRNFGKESAMFAGLEAADGDYVAVMDADLQDPPALLSDMVYGIEYEGYDIVGTRRVSRKGEPPIRSFFARKFYQLINKFVEVEIVDGARDYRLMKRDVINSILKMREYNRFSKGIFAWVGFKTKYLEYENIERVAGETSWSFWKLVKYAIQGIVAFTTAPLQLSTILGIIVSILSFVYMLFVFFKAIVYGDPVAGYPSLMVVITFLGGVQLVSLGVLGEYISKMYLEVKQRPIYLIKEVVEYEKN